MGKPLKFTPEEFDTKIQGYFKFCIESKKVPTKGGLALYLDTSRETLSEYEERPNYVDAIKKAYGIIEDEWVQRLAGNNVAGTIFYLKNAFSKYWRDKQETEHTGELTFTQRFMKNEEAK